MRGTGGATDVVNNDRMVKGLDPKSCMRPLEMSAARKPPMNEPAVFGKSESIGKTKWLAFRCRATVVVCMDQSEVLAHPIGLSAAARSLARPQTEGALAGELLPESDTRPRQPSRTKDSERSRRDPEPKSELAHQVDCVARDLLADGVEVGPRVYALRREA